MDRAEALETLKGGFPVLHRDDKGERLVESPVASNGVHGRRLCDAVLPAEGDFAPARHPDGTWTHEALAALTRSGQGVLHRGDVLASPDDLPAAHELAGADAKKQQAVLEGLDSQIAALVGQRQKAAHAAEKAGASAEMKAAPQKQADPEWEEFREWKRQREAAGVTTQPGEATPPPGPGEGEASNPAEPSPQPDQPPPLTEEQAAEQESSRSGRRRRREE